MNPPLHILIVDDCTLFAEAVSALLNAQQEVPIVSLASAITQATEQARSLAANVVLVNAAMEKAVALQVIRKIREELSNIKVVVIGLPQSDDMALEFIEAGASGYVFKEETLAELVRTIEAVHRNQAPCTPQIAASVFARINQLSTEQKEREMLEHVRLTKRERDILSLIANGLSNKEIAYHFNLSLSTVKNHVHNILDKLHVHHRREAVRFAYGNAHPQSPSSSLSFLKAN